MGTVLAFATQLLGSLPSLIEAGINVTSLVKNGNDVLTKAQAEGRDPTAEEWDALNARIAVLRKALHD